MSEPAFLYVITDDSGAHKVGLSVEPRKRLSSLQTGNPRRLRIARKTPAPDVSAGAVEAYAHWLLREAQVLGEWFAVTEEAAWVALVAAAEAVASGQAIPGPERTAGPGRPRINDPGQTTSARFATGSLARIRAALEPGESMNGFIKAAVEAELTRRERAARKPKPD